jgi:hypothetical protein
VRGHRHHLLTVAALAGILALGAGFPAGGVSAERWVSSVCTSLSDWADALVEAQENHDLDATDPEESKDALVGYLEEVTNETEALIKALKKAGTPAVDDGKALAKTFRKGFIQARDTFEDAVDAARDLDTDDKSAFQDDVLEIRDAIASGAAEIGETFDDADEKYDVPEVDEAFKAEPACTGIN